MAIVIFNLDHGANMGPTWVRNTKDDFEVRFTCAREHCDKIILQSFSEISMYLCVRPKMLWITWWRHQMGIFSALLALCEGNPPVTRDAMVLFVQSNELHMSFSLEGTRWITHSIYSSSQPLSTPISCLSLSSHTRLLDGSAFVLDVIIKFILRSFLAGTQLSLAIHDISRHNSRQ